MFNSIVVFCAQYLYLAVCLVAAVYFLNISRTKQIDLGALAIIALPSIFLISRVAAHFYFDPRPFVVGHFIPLINHAPDNGFPSDHALLTSAIASVITVYNKRVGIALWILTIIIGTARVLAGVHHPVDIIGGILISVVTTVFVDFLLRKQNFFPYRNNHL